MWDGIRGDGHVKVAKFYASIWVQMLLWGSRVFGKSEVWLKEVRVNEQDKNLGNRRILLSYFVRNLSI